MSWYRRWTQQRKAHRLNCTVEAALASKYRAYDISPELTKYDQQVLMQALSYLIGFLTNFNQDIWQSMPLEQRKAKTRELYRGLAEAINLNLKEVKFVSFRSKTARAMTETKLPGFGFPTSTAVVSIDWLQKYALSDILPDSIHECGHIYQTKLVWKKCTFGMTSDLPRDVLILEQEDKDNLRNKGQLKSTYDHSLTERHANAFAGALVEALKIIIPQSFTPKPADKFTPGF